MARDYSSRRNNSSSNSGKRKSGKRPAPAARPTRKRKAAHKKKTTSRRNPATSSRPGCIWLISLALLFVAAAAVYYIATRPTGHGPQGTQLKSLDTPQEQEIQPSVDQNSPTPAKSPKNTTEQVDNTKAEPQFSFYEMLPSYQVKIPASKKKRKPVVDNSAPHEVDPAQSTQIPTQPEDTEPEPQGRFILQAGAFSHQKDADRRKAKLTLLGVTAEIVKATSADGKTIYRVQSQLIDSRDKAEKMSQRLSSHGIETFTRQAQ